jgi:hypothetical protein
LSAENGAEKTASCKKRQSDECWNKEGDKHEGHPGSDASLKWKWGDHVVGMEQRRRAHPTSIWDVRLVKRRTERPKTRWADTFKTVAAG